MGTGRCLLLDCDFYCEDLPVCSETHLQLPLKLNYVVGVMDEDLGLNDGKQTKESLEET